MIAPIPLLKGLVRDDGLFYLKIAENFSQGFGSTFDRLQETNGYHPLQMLCLSGLFYFLDTIGFSTSENHFRFTLIYSLILISISIYFCIRIVEHISQKQLTGWDKTILIIFMAAFAFSTEMLSEAIVVTALTALLLHEFSFQKYRIACILIPLIFLARIDLLPLAIFLTAYTFYKNRKEGIKSFIFLVLIIAAYFYSNYYFFGHYITVSAYIKTQVWERIPPLAKAKMCLSQLTGRIGILNVFYFSSLLFYVLNRKTKFYPQQKHLYNLILATATGGYIYILSMMFLNANLRDWYFIWPVFLIGISLFAGIELFKQSETKINLHLFNISSKKIINIFITFMLLSAIACISYIISGRSWNQACYYNAIWVKDQLPENEYLFQVDGAGAIAFFSGRNVVNADGLVGSFEYTEKLFSNRLSQFLKDNKIKYLGIAEDIKKRLIRADNTVNYRGNWFKVIPFKNFNQQYFIYEIELD